MFSYNCNGLFFMQNEFSYNFCCKNQNKILQQNVMMQKEMTNDNISDFMNRLIQIFRIRYELMIFIVLEK